MKAGGEWQPSRQAIAAHGMAERSFRRHMDGVRRDARNVAGHRTAARHRQPDFWIARQRQVPKQIGALGIRF